METSGLPLEPLTETAVTDRKLSAQIDWTQIGFTDAEIRVLAAASLNDCDAQDEQKIKLVGGSKWRETLLFLDPSKFNMLRNLSPIYCALTPKGALVRPQTSAYCMTGAPDS